MVFDNDLIAQTRKNIPCRGFKSKKAWTIVLFSGVKGKQTNCSNSFIMFSHFNFTL